MKTPEVICRTAITYGRTKEISEYAIASVLNELLAEGVGMSDAREWKLQILAPEDADKNDLYAVKKQAERCCKEQGIFDMQITIKRSAAVNHTTVFVTAADVRAGNTVCEEGQEVILTPKDSAWHRETMRAGQDIVLANNIALSGTLQILDEKEKELSTRFTTVFLEQIRDLRKDIFAMREIQAAKAESVSVMRQVGEGGIYAALYRLAKEAGTGLVADLKKISVRQETIELCECYRLNPYQLASAGSILMICDNGEALADTLREQNMTASVIGRLTGDNDMVIRNGEDIRYIDRPAPDEINKIFE